MMAITVASKTMPPWQIGRYWLAWNPEYHRAILKSDSLSNIFYNFWSLGIAFMYLVFLILGKFKELILFLGCYFLKKWIYLTSKWSSVVFQK